MNNPPSIALIHGWATEPSIWDPVRAKLEDQGYSVAVYEMPGYGSRNEEIGTLSLTELVDDAIGQLPTNALWVGWSLGAMIALSAAAKENSAIAGVMAVCATAKFCCNQHKTVSLDELRKAVDKNPEKAVSRFQRSMPSPAHRRAILKQLGTALVLPLTKETLLSGLKILSRADLDQEVNKIEVPVRLVSGIEDPIIPASSAIELNDLISGSKFTALPCGHIPFLECPQLFMEQLVEFARTTTDSPADPKSI